MKLTTPISEITKLSKDHQAGLARLKLITVKDLLFHFPVRYADQRELASIETVAKGSPCTIVGILEKVSVRRSFKGHIPLTEARIQDNSGSMRLVWFNQAYIGKMYPEGSHVKVSGIAQEDSKGTFLSNPSIERVLEAAPEPQEGLFAEGTREEFLVPVYRETKGVTSNFIYHLIKRAVAGNVLENIEDPIPSYVTKALHLPELKDALLYIHFPKHINLTTAARKRFAFEEIFYMRLTSYKEKLLAHHELAYSIESPSHTIDPFIDSFSFKPTQAQNNAIKTILKDIKKPDPMGRLLEGDVGSGKTFVAAVASYAVIHNHSGKAGTPYQVAYMAPTEILATQHFESFCNFFKDTSIEIALITGSGCKKFPSKSNNEVATAISRTQLLKWVQEGKISIVIGTHALIQKSVIFKELALVIIDEQHRFGVKQRKALAHKREARGALPHLLSMTATPIPRTLALTMFGDLDLTVIDEMPKGRKRIATELVRPKDRKQIYEHIRKELKSGRQVYVICPRIESSDEEDGTKQTMRNVEDEAKRLAEDIFPEFIVDILHGKMKADDKEEVMRDFLEKKSDILVATSVVEVGVNVPNASVIIIEGAERFGLAQLHQLRGRVGRAEHQSYCYLFTDSTHEHTEKRLVSLVEAKNGFELAERDMMERGIGTLSAGKQWGISDLAMEAIKNPKLVELAGTYAKEILDNDETLENFPELKEIIKQKELVHME